MPRRIGHYGKALNEDAINGKDFKPQWPKHWNNTSPLAGGATFQTLNANRRLDLLKHLTLWSLGHSDAVKAIINANYNGKRMADDLNQPLSVQPWGVDSDKRRYYLIEGDDNCSFRVYRESNPAALYNRQWISVAGSIDEVKTLADKLATLDGGPNARKLSNYIIKNIVNFEEKEEKRKRREYRRQQKERFRRPEPGFSLYEGRTRGKRVKYTYSDDEDFYTDSTNRRSTRNTRNPSPVEAVPVVTASGRQSRPPARLNADTLSNGDASAAPSVQGDVVDTEMSEAPEIGPNGRPRRSAAANHGTNGWAHPRKRRHDYVSDDEDEEEDEPDFGDDEGDDHVPQEETEDEEEFENDAMDEDDQDVTGGSPRSNDSRMVKLPIKVTIDKNGKVKRLTNDGDTPATTPSNLVSSPAAADESSEESPSDAPTHEPEQTGEMISVAPLKRSEPDQKQEQILEQMATAAVTDGDGQSRPSSTPNNPLADDSTVSAETLVNPSPIVASSANGAPANGPAATSAPPASGLAAPAESKSLSSTSLPPVEKFPVPVEPSSTPRGGVSPSLAFRDSPEKARAPPPPVLASVNGE